MKKLMGVFALLLLLAACGDFQWLPGPNPNVDTTPDAFSFTTQCPVALNVAVVSNTITVTGINGPTPISIVGGEYAIDASTSFTSSTSTISSGQLVRVQPPGGKLTSTGTFNITLTIGGVSGTFKVSTDACIQTT